MSTEDLLRLAIEAVRGGRREEARGLLMQVVEAEPRSETAWIWLSGLMDSLEDRIIACENVLVLNPGNQKVRQYLLELQRQQTAAQQHKPAGIVEPVRQPENSDARENLVAESVRNSAGPESVRPHVVKQNPLEIAADLEVEGRFDEAIRVYQEQAAGTKSSYEFDRLYAHITRLEQLQKEKIRHVPPAASIFRLTAAWSLLYVALVLMQAGLNPLAHLQVAFWAMLPFVIFGGFLLSMAEVRSRNIIWQKLFAAPGVFSWLARFFFVVAGWSLILLPNLLLVADALRRLSDFQIPPLPPV